MPGALYSKKMTEGGICTTNQ